MLVIVKLEFALTTKIPNADWTADREDLLHL